VTSYANFYRTYRELIAERYPSCAQTAGEADLERLVSPHILRLPNSVCDFAQDAIQVHYHLAGRENFRRHIMLDQPWLTNVPLRTAAVLMAYDFHTTEDGRAYLVEVNTNASSYMLADALCAAHGMGGRRMAELREAFHSEATAHSAPVRRVALVDDDVAGQKMYIEFLMYRDWLKAQGWDAVIANGADLTFTGGKLMAEGAPVDLVYNRLTDFYLEDPSHAALREAYEKSAAVVTPHPWAYHLFSDKARLVELSKEGWLEEAGAAEPECRKLRHVLIPTHTILQMGGPDEVWAKRKHLFFKPRQSHGGKSVYRGESVSKKVFERLMDEDVLVQEFVPAQSWPAAGPDDPMANWKFDVRFYAYSGRVQFAVARSYQGQVTNFSSRYGGLTAIEFV
jgi:hypothetical protein